MDRTQMIALASPPCHECGSPVQRVEARWHLDEDYAWRPGPNYMVCGDGHRVLIRPFYFRDEGAARASVPRLQQEGLSAARYAS